VREEQCLIFLLCDRLKGNRVEYLGGSKEGKKRKREELRWMLWRKKRLSRGSWRDELVLVLEKRKKVRT
jgi:hypothetical protein